MISDLKQTVTKSFLQVISDEWIWFWKWNKNKTIFKFNLDEYLLFNEYIKLNNNSSPHYIEYFTKSLESLEALGVLKSYKNTSESWDIKFDEKEFIKNTGSKVLNFENIYKKIGGDYLLEYDINKLKLLKEILYNTKKVKYIFSLWLLKAILKVIYNQNELKSDSVGNILKVQNHIDIDVLIDYLNIDNEKNIFYDFKVLIYALSTYKMEYIAKIISFLLEVLDKENKYILLKSIKLDNNLYYFEEDDIYEIKDSYNWMNEWNKSSHLSYLKKNKEFDELLILEWKNEWNIYYYEKYLSKNNTSIILSNSSIKYDKKASILEFAWKKVNFSQAKWQRELVERLYDNINNWVSEDVIWKKWQQILKDIRIKMKKKTWGWFTSLEIKQLFQTFEDNKKRYFIMIW